MVVEGEELQGPQVMVVVEEVPLVHQEEEGFLVLQGVGVVVVVVVLLGLQEVEGEGEEVLLIEEVEVVMKPTLIQDTYIHQHCKIYVCLYQNLCLHLIHTHIHHCLPLYSSSSQQFSFQDPLQKQIMVMYSSFAYHRQKTTQSYQDFVVQYIVCENETWPWDSKVGVIKWVSD